MSMAKRPNILVFLTDDHAQWAVQTYGCDELHTPSMDYLAETGAKMANAFTPCPVCSPARASFHTGRMPSAHGIHDHIGELKNGKDHPGIRGQTSLAEVLQERGYYTGLVGKWHLNHFWESPPGFDVWFSNATGTNARFGTQPFFEGDQRVEGFGNQANIITDRALRFLRERDTARPFFLFVGYTNTHTPHIDEPDRWVNYYRKKTFSHLPNETASGVHGASKFVYPDDPDTRHEASAQYYSAVSLIDEMMGRMIDELANQEEMDNTLIVYTSDHGHMNGHHGLHSKGNATVPQNFLEESIRIPCLLSWPGQIQPGKTYTQSVDHCDLFMTLADVAGCDCAKLKKAPALSGTSYLLLLRGESDISWREAQCCEYGNARMIRTDRLKLIKRYPGPNGHFDDELYDLKKDPQETCNVLNLLEYASQVRELEQQLEAFFRQLKMEEYSGVRIADLPQHNGGEPWTLDPDALNS
jgi:choline-sulfatase